MAKFSSYPPLDGLVDLACRDGVDIRPTLLRVITDLYVQKLAHSAEEENQYIELARGLIEVGRCADACRGGGDPVGLSGGAGGYSRQAWRRGAARPLCAGPKPKPRRDLTELFFAADARERRLILTNLDCRRHGPARRRPAQRAN